MTKEQGGPRIGIADFAEPTLLLASESRSFEWLAEKIASRRTFALERMCTGGWVILRFVPAEQRGCLSQRDGAFEWQVSVAEAQKVAHQLRELAASTHPAHAYLDPTSNSTEVQIVASVGEYEATRAFDE